MRDVVWRTLEREASARRPRTWVNESPSNLQSLKGDDVFKAIGSDRTLNAIDDVIGTRKGTQPSDWGAYFLLFPTRRVWNVPWKAWHLDHDYARPLSPVDGLKVHSMFGDVAPRAGGMTIVAGSHHVVARHFADHPPRPGAKGRRSCASSSCAATTISASWAPIGERPAAQIARFFEHGRGRVRHRELRVVELTATAGDVILIHPLVLHARPTNAGTQPRFLLNKDLSLKTPAALQTSRLTPPSS